MVLLKIYNDIFIEDFFFFKEILIYFELLNFMVKNVEIFF